MDPTKLVFVFRLNEGFVKYMRLIEFVSSIRNYL